MGHVFISYAHKDSDYAQQLVTELEARGNTTWIDAKIPKGRRIVGENRD